MFSQEKTGGDKPLPYEKKFVGAILACPARVAARKTFDFNQEAEQG